MLEYGYFNRIDVRKNLGRVTNYDDLNDEYREYPKIGNCPTLPACTILHMDRRKKGSFLFLGFPCIKLVSPMFSKNSPIYEYSDAFNVWHITRKASDFL